MKSSHVTFLTFALSLIPGVGIKKILPLVSHFGNPDDLFQVSPGALSQIAGISLTLARQISAMGSFDFAVTQWEELKQKNIRVWDYYHPHYPDLLKEIHSPPPVLYLRGEIDFSQGFPIAFVGSRKATHYGKTQTARFVQQLAKKVPDAVIVSGMALGVDTVAHETAIECGLKTIAVLGSGFNHLYPPQNRMLAEKIAINGALITEFPYHARPVAANFPVRNRIISGISKGTIVIEAGEKSGALITARNAVEQNREVFALPGLADSFSSKGTNRLIQRGQAKLVLEIEDILEEFQMVSVTSEQLSFDDLSPSDEVIEINSEEKKILALLNNESCHIDLLAQATGIPMNRLLAMLTTLEMRGLVTSKVGATYLRKN